VFTALGDAVNVAARLQDLTKTLNCTVVISDEIWKNAGVAYQKLDRVDVPIRGRDQPMTVFTVADATTLGSLLDAQAEEAAANSKASAYDLA
jgi:adenylate cyclase